MDAPGQKSRAASGSPRSPPSTARSKKQLRHEKHKPRNRHRNGSDGSSGSSSSSSSAGPGIQDAELSAFERVKRLKHFDRFDGDIEDLLTELIDKVLAGGEGVEPRAEKRDELATLMLWHAEFDALAREGGDKNAESMEMRALILELGECFDRVTHTEGRDTERAPYDALIKVYSMRKKQKESRRRRSREKDE
ncbi:hypothetical protein E4U55_005703 [Claviceps digitariae]|nr:hypothetical protein E4U55_005703 [Claviceps digitariae]